MPERRDPLSDALGHLSQHARSGAHVTPAAEIRRLGDRRRQRRQSALAGAGVLVVALGVAGVVTLRPGGDDPGAHIVAASPTATTTPDATQSPTATFTITATAGPTTSPDSRPSSPGTTPTPAVTPSGPATSPGTAHPSASSSPSPARSLEVFDVVAVGSAMQRGENYLRVETDVRCSTLAELFGGSFRYPSPTRLEGCVEVDGVETATFRVDPRVAITPLTSGSRLGTHNPRSFSTLAGLIEKATEPVGLQVRVDADGLIKAIVELPVVDLEPAPSPQAGS